MMKAISGLHRTLRRRVFDIAFDSLTVSRILRRTHTVVCGDSHVEVFSHIRRADLAPAFLFDVIKVNGATAQGMINPNSRTNALGIFKARISRMKPWQDVFFQLGEVDCGFVIWHYAEKNELSLDDQFQRSIRNYRSLIEWTLGRGIRRIGILSAPPPTIKDEQTWGEIANARKSVSATLDERTALTIRYNDALKNMADDLGLQYMDITSILLDENSGLVADRFMNKDPLDHHLDTGAYAKVICELLAQPTTVGRKHQE